MRTGAPEQWGWAPTAGGNTAPPPAPRPSALAVTLSALLLAALIAAPAVLHQTPAPPTAQGGAFSGHGISFSYPASWTWITGPGFGAEAGNRLWSEGFFPGPSEGLSYVAVTAYRLPFDADLQPVTALAAQLKTVMSTLATRFNGSLTSGPTSVQVDGAQAFSATITFQQAGQDLTTQVVAVFSGSTQYNINCEYTADSQAQVSGACAQVVSSFRLG